MSDWDILAPVESQGAEPQVNENDDAGGMFLADNDADNDSFGLDLSNEAQSFNPRMQNEHFKRKDVYRHRGDFNHNEPVNKAPQSKGFSYKDMSHSYTDRKIHDASDFGPRGYRPRRGSIHRRNRRDTSDSDYALASVPHDLLEGGFDEARYNEFHELAKHQRYENGIGKAPEMNSLYYFWCYYLRENFDQKMFDEFIETARQDSIGHSHYGIECFFRFCSYGLEKRWDEKIFDIFQREALKDFKRGSKYGLEKVKGFLVHQKFGFPIVLLPEMESVLAQFPTLESFKESPQKTNGKGKKHNRQQQQQQQQQKSGAVDQQQQQRRSSKIEVSRPQKGKGGANASISIVRHVEGQEQNINNNNNNEGAAEKGYGEEKPSSAPNVDSPIRSDI